MTRARLPILLILASLALPAGAETPGHDSPPPAPDPYLWLEEIDGEKAMAWVERENRSTAERLKSKPRFASLLAEAREILDASSRIPDLDQRGEHVYMLWRDESHPRGLYRRTTVERLGAEDPEWQTVLDIDALSEAEGEAWVFKSISCLPPENRHCLVKLSPGGGDAVQVREFDMEHLRFVPGGFFVPAAKTHVAWIDASSIYIATDFGEGSMTASGYPRINKVWRRGTPLTEAATIFEGGQDSVSARVRRLRSDGGDIDLAADSTTFWETTYSQLLDGEAHALRLPPTARVADAYRGRLVVSLQDDWQVGDETFGQGSVLIADPQALRGGEGEIEALVAPTTGEVVEAIKVSKKGILVTMLDNVRGRLYRYDVNEDGSWSRKAIPFPDHGSLDVTSLDDDSGVALVHYESFTTPPTLYQVAGPEWQPREVMTQAPTFDGSRFEVEQLWATSRDGTRVPYFVVHPKGMERNGKNPTHIFSYGGFRNALTPAYSGSYEKLYGAYGKLWLERGGVFVLANIRGGDEFGPAWHQAALLENRPRAYEDFEAIVEDLVTRRITAPQHVGIEGRSNGGLLVGALSIRRPELYGAVVCGAPLLDMKRYHLLLAGASWMAEYGDPDDPEQWAFLSTYSPYQNLEKGVDYPPTFFYLSTRDDRVHPGHARKMAARMKELGQEVWYYENTEGGHGGSSTNEQLAYRLALAYTHLWEQLK